MQPFEGRSWPGNGKDSNRYGGVFDQKAIERGHCGITDQECKFGTSPTVSPRPYQCEAVESILRHLSEYQLVLRQDHIGGRERMIEVQKLNQGGSSNIEPRGRRTDDDSFRSRR